MLNKKSNLELFGDFKERIIKAKSRFSFILFFLFFGFFLITLKIINLSVNYNKELVNNTFEQNQLVTGFRADIIDRNGVKLATSIIKYDFQTQTNPSTFFSNKFFFLVISNLI